MRWLERSSRWIAIFGFAWLSSHFALQFGTGDLWRGLGAAHAVAGEQVSAEPYDLTQLNAVSETLKKIRTKYVDPSRVDPQQMFLSALNQIQKEVAPVIVLHDDKSPSVRVRADTEEREFRVDNVQGPWDVAARLREVFVFLQEQLKDSDVKLEEVEYAACNGMLQTLDPHSVFLSPEAYGEMNLSTSGHFGGLGIVIAMRDQMLTVMRPIPGTPASKGGLRRLDRILQINNEATLNMPLDDAVRRLRGTPGSDVTVWVHRDGKDGWVGTRPIKLVREVIRIESVDARELAPGVGYVRLQQFQASTADELHAALAGFQKKERLKGLVLDLRGNPGGLLDQAAQVADTFLSRGVIVSTVGNSEGREEKRAQVAGTEPEYPIVVLVDGSSASASEIVAGALKNQDRAVLVGQTTFGKGSVQLVFSQIAGGAALKLTIAQYLTPGDISIQGVGVTPDIELDPMTADNLEMDLFRGEPRLRERDLDKSLTNQAVRTSERPTATLRYNLPESERKEMRELGGAVRDEFYLDFPIRFARDLVARLPDGKSRPEQLQAVKAVIDGEQATQMTAVASELSKFGIRWDAAPANAKPELSSADFLVHAETDRPSDSVVAGQQMNLSVSVTNKGKVAAHRVRAITKSDSGYFDERELVFGRIDPGQTIKAVAPLGFCRIKGRPVGTSQPLPLDAPRECRIPEDALTRQDGLRVRFSMDGGEAPTDAELRPTVTSLPQPTFAYTYQVMDDRPGNGDGQLSRGEGVTVYVDIQNTGKGASHETQALLRNLTGDGLLLHGGRFDVSGMKPGEKRQVAFTFDVLESLTENLAKIEVSIIDRDLRVSVADKISLPIVNGGFAIKDAPASVSVPARSVIRSQPLAVAPEVGAVDAGARLNKLGEFGEFSKVALGKGRTGFIATAELRPGGGPEDPKFEALLSHSPPLLEVEPAALSTRAPTFSLRGVVRDSDQVRDTYIFIGSRKVFYKSNRKGADPKSMTFEHELQLQPGVNLITVVSRENNDVATARTLVVRRDGPEGEVLPTPKRDLFGEDWSFSMEGE